jgi:hypothetical protein
MTAAPGAALAQTTGTDTALAEARASIVRSISIAAVEPLAFGALSPGGSAFTVRLTPSGEISASEPDVLVPSRVSAGAFSVTGQPGRVYTVALPGSFSLASGTSALQVSDMVLQFEGEAEAGGSGVLDAEGTQRFTVGATLGVAAKQPSGRYTGSYTVTVRYQ